MQTAPLGQALFECTRCIVCAVLKNTMSPFNTNMTFLYVTDSGSWLSTLLPKPHHQPADPHTDSLRLCCHNPDSHTSGLTHGRGRGCPGGLRSGYHCHTWKHLGVNLMFKVCLEAGCYCVILCTFQRSKEKFEKWPTHCCWLHHQHDVLSG